MPDDGLSPRDSLEARSAGGGGAHFRGVDAEAEMGEVSLAEGHAAGVEVAPDEEKQERNSGVVFVGYGVGDSRGEINPQKNFGVGNPSSFVFVFLRDKCVLFPFDFEFRRAGEFRFFSDNGFEDGLGVSNGNADADGHDERHVEKGAPPGFGAKLFLRDEVEAGDRASGSEEQRQVDEEHLEPALIEADDHHGQERDREEDHQGIADVGGQMKKCFGLHVPWRVGFQNFRKNFLGRLHQAFGPASLLGLETVHVYGKFGSTLDAGQIEKFPAAKLRTVGKIGVFGERVVFPATGGFDGRPAPNSGGAVEIEESAAAGTSAVFDDEVAIEQNRFDLREERVVAIEIGPAGLDHADVLSFNEIEKIRNGAAKEVGFRDEVRVEDGDEFSLGSLEAVFEGAGFEPFAISPVNVGDGHALGGMAVNAGFGDFAGFVGGIVEDLNVEKFARVVEARNSFDKALDDIALVENGKLNGDARPLFYFRRRAGNVLAVLIVVVDKPVAMKTVAGEDDEDDEVGNHHSKVEGVGVVDAGESAISELVPIAAQATLGKKEKGSQKEHGHHGNIQL